MAPPRRISHHLGSVSTVGSGVALSTSIDSIPLSLYPPPPPPSPPCRPPPSLLRQEVAGTQLYLIVLLRSLADPAADRLPPPVSSQMVLKSGAADSESEGRTLFSNSLAVRKQGGGGGRSERERAERAGRGGESGEGDSEEEKRRLQSEAEEQLVSLCGRVLEDSARLQPVAGQAVAADVHRSLALRAPVVARVRRGGKEWGR